MDHPTPEQLSAPSLRLAFLQIWVHGRQFPDATDRWDGNWLNVVVHCGADGASVWAKGAILDTLALSRFRDDIDRIYRTLAGEAVLDSDEPNIKAHVKSNDKAGHLRIRVELTPDHRLQGHWFEFEADQTYLPPLIAQLDTVLKTFPVRGI
jgi:hypothetical protein